jgi:hypothetical protein
MTIGGMAGMAVTAPLGAFLDHSRQSDANDPQYTWNEVPPPVSRDGTEPRKIIKYLKGR